jgi:hypothetical protein
VGGRQRRTLHSCRWSCRISEVLVVELLAIIDRQFGWDSEPTYDILPEKFMCCLGCYCGDCSALDPLGEVFDSDEGEFEIPLSSG